MIQKAFASAHVLDAYLEIKPIDLPGQPHVCDQQEAALSFLKA